MPVTPTYPGVYVVEVPSGVRTITGVPTSVAAFIGRASRGPTDEPRMINSFGDFERIFGGLWQGSSLGYAVRDFFLNGGGQAIVVRLFHPNYASEDDRASAVQAAADTAAAAAGAADANAAAAKVRAKADTFAEEPEHAAAASVADDAERAASGGSTVADVQKAAADAAANESGNPAAQATADAAQGADAAAAAKAARDKAKTYTTDPDKTAAAHVADAADTASSAGATADDVETAAAEGAKSAAPRGRALLDVGFPMEAASPGAWGNLLRARVDYDVLGDDSGQRFNLAVRDGLTGTVEVHRNVSVAAGDVRRVDKVLAHESQLVRVSGSPPATRPDASKDPDPTLGESDVWADNKAATNTKVAHDGLASDGTWLDVNDFTGMGKENAKQGLYALRKADLFNILCIPPYLESGDVDYNSLIPAAAAYCERRRAMLLLDPPSSWGSKDAAREGVADIGTNSKNAALYFPRLRQPDPTRAGQVGEFVPCGAVAGIFARTDTNRGVWKAPAGLDATLVGVPELAVSLTDAENGELNPLGVNCLRTMPPIGRVVWGARTRQGDDRLASEWKYVPIRRTALFIEESLYRGTQWVVFEPNDEPLWAQIRLNIGAFMQNLFRQGAFQGTTPAEAYFVKWVKETTTENDRNLGIVNIVVGFAPLKPVEFVIISIQQIAGQIQV
jgi:phage tail sheath protein FI